MSRFSMHCELCIVVALAACSDGELAAVPADVEPVSGPSWVEHLGLEVDQTVLGHLGGDGGAPAASAAHTTGADLYRFLCRSCHGPDARGQPPAVGSALAGAAAASADLLQQRMRARGTPITAAMAASLARDARTAIDHRLQHGGVRMPPFAYLRPGERQALVSYLEHLAGSKIELPEIREPRVRIGELVVRGTCHICHPATEADRAEHPLQVPVPTLASFERFSNPLVIYAVTRGSTKTPPGAALTKYTDRARMPALPYLGANEIAAALEYIQLAPPSNSDPQKRSQP